MKKDNREFYQKLFVLVIPIAIQNLMSALVGASDALMLGRMDQSSLAAVSLATQVQFVLGLFYISFTIGMTTLAAQYWGKGDKASVEKVLAIAIRISMLVSGLFFLAALCVPQVLMRIFTNEQALIVLGVPYLRIVSVAYLCGGITQVYLCIMKNSGRTLRSMIFGSTTVVVNIVLNAIFIYGLFGFPQMGISGAALATVCARMIELALVLWENNKKEVVKIRFKYVQKGDPVLKKDFYHYTRPVLIDELLWGCGFTMFSVIMGHMGSDAVAANSIANIMKNILICMGLGIGEGTGIIIGNELGAGRLERAKEYGRKLCRATFVTGVISGGLLLALSPLVLHLVTSLTPQAGIYLKWMLVICAYYIIGKCMNVTIIGGVFCAGGDTRFGMYCDLVTMWFIIVPLGALAAFVFELPVMAVYFLLNLDEFVKLPAVYLHYKKYGWVKNLTR